jgi:LPS-assembly protein
MSLSKYLIFFLIALFCTELSANTKKIDYTDFKADNITYDIKQDIIVATGNVIFSSDKQFLKADVIYYESKSDLMYAKGNVVYINGEGDEISAEKLELDSDLKTGLIYEMKVLLSNKATLWADLVDKKNECIYDIKDIGYTACSLIGDISPTWSVRASSGTYNSDTEILTLYNVWAEVKGIPLIWMPYLRFTNLQNNRQIGFLTPTYENSGLFGSSLVIPFYIPIGQSQDIKIITKLYKKEYNPTNIIKYNGYIGAGSFNFDGSFADKNDVTNERGWHIFFDANQNITDTLRANINIEKVAYYNYLEKYDINPKDSKRSFLDNEVKLENFYDYNNYSSIYYYKGETINLDFKDYIVYNQNISLNHSYFGDINEFGRVNFDLNVSDFSIDDKKYKDFNFTNVQRSSINLNYSYYFYSTYFGQYIFDSSLVYSNYNFKDNEFMKDNNISNIASSITWEYPLVYSVKSNYFTTISPAAQFVFSKNLLDNQNDLTFDSSAPNINSNTIFALRQQDGYDIFYNEKLAKYGIRASMINESSQGGRAFFGQLIKVSDSLDGTNLSVSDNSNYFLSLNIYPIKGIDITIDNVFNNNFSVLENVSKLRVYNDYFMSEISYSFYELDPSIYSNPTISEVGTTNSLKLTKNITINLGTLNNLTDKNSSLKELTSGIIFIDECYSLEIYIKRKFYEITTSTVGFRLNIRTAGGIGLEY